MAGWLFTDTFDLDAERGELQNEADVVTELIKKAISENAHKAADVLDFRQTVPGFFKAGAVPFIFALVFFLILRLMRIFGNGLFYKLSSFSVLHFENKVRCSSVNSAGPVCLPIVTIIAPFWELE